MIPCIRDKCLKYPICIAHTNISCDDLQDYFNSIHYSIMETYVKPSKKKSVFDVFDLNLEERNKAWDETWAELQKYLPNINGMFRSTTRQKMANSSDPHYIGGIK